MPSQPEEVRKIQLLASIARYLYDQARVLYTCATGEDIHGNEITNVAPELDTIPLDTDGHRWASAAARFIRYLAHLLQMSLQEESEGNAARLLQAISQNVNAEDIENLFDEGEI